MTHPPHPTHTFPCIPTHIPQCLSCYFTPPTPPHPCLPMHPHTYPPMFVMLLHTTHPTPPMPSHASLHISPNVCHVTSHHLPHPTQAHTAHPTPATHAFSHIPTLPYLNIFKVYGVVGLKIFHIPPKILCVGGLNTFLYLPKKILVCVGGRGSKN